MSVSLRERVAEIIQQHKQLSDRWKILEITDQILSLFPPQLTEEEVEKILPKKDLFPKDHIQPTCQCPECIAIENRNQAIDDCKSALIGKCGNKDMVTREYACDMALKAKKSGWDDALKYYKINEATPTFSGGEKEVDFEIQRLAGMAQYKPEPKPKDRIEELELIKYAAMPTNEDLAKKINELIRHINKES